MAMACKLLASTYSEPSFAHSLIRSCHSSFSNRVYFVRVILGNLHMHPSEHAICGFVYVFFWFAISSWFANGTDSHSHRTQSRCSSFMQCCLFEFLVLRNISLFECVCFVCVRQVHKWIKWMNGNKQKRNAFHDARYFGFFSFLVAFWSLCAVIIIVIITVYYSPIDANCWVSGLTNTQ